VALLVEFIAALLVESASMGIVSVKLFMHRSPYRLGFELRTVRRFM